MVPLVYDCWLTEHKIVQSDVSKYKLSSKYLLSNGLNSPPEKWQFFFFLFFFFLIQKIISKGFTVCNVGRILVCRKDLFFCIFQLKRGEHKVSATWRTQKKLHLFCGLVKRWHQTLAQYGLPIDSKDLKDFGKFWNVIWLIQEKKNWI